MYMFSNSQAYPTGMLQSKESVKSTSHVAHLKNYSRILMQQQSWILSKKSNFYHVGCRSVSVCVWMIAMLLRVVEMFGSCLVIITVAALYEGLKVLRDCLVQKACTANATYNGDAVAVPTTDIPSTEIVKLPNR